MGGVMWGLLHVHVSKIKFGGVCYQDTYPVYLACISHVSCMYLDVSRSYMQDTFKDTYLEPYLRPSLDERWKARNIGNTDFVSVNLTKGV
jgi:hypothetical protein